jgi:hypothetical protein
MKTNPTLKEGREERRRARELRQHGPMTCKDPQCVDFRKRDPAFAERLQKAGIIAHYMGTNGLCTGPGDYWMLSGITPVSRAGLQELIGDYPLATSNKV